MKKFIVLLFVLALAAAASIFLVNDKGYLLLVVSEHLVKMPLWLGAAAILLIMFALWFVFSIIKSVLGFPTWLGRRRQHKKQQKALNALKYNIRSIILNDWPQVEKQNQHSHHFKALGLSQESELLQLKAYLEQEEYELINKAYSRHANIFKVNEGYAWVYAHALLKQGEYQDAEKVIMEVLKRAEYPHALYQTLAELYLKAQDYASLKSLLPNLEKNKFSKREYSFYQNRAYQGLLTQTARESQLSFENFWESIPRKIKHESIIIDAYIKGLYSLKEYAKAEQLLQKRLAKQWDEVLFELYIESHLKNGDVSFELVSRWIEHYRPQLSTHAAHLYARAAITAKRYNDAEEILRTLGIATSCARTCILFSEVYRAQNMLTKANEYQQKALDILKG